MATITGTIHHPNSVASKSLTVTFIPLDTPTAVGSEIIDTANVAVITDTSGALPAATVLVAGYYTVQLSSNGTDYGSFTILVPSGVGTHDITSLVVETPGAAVQQIIYGAGIEDPNGVVTAKAAIFFNNLGGLWVHPTTTRSNTGWIQYLG